VSLVVFLRGVNVGGNRTFRPAILARELSAYDVVNIGAAGTFVIRKPAGEAKVRREFKSRLPFEAEIMICEGRDLIEIASTDRFPGIPSRPDIVRFVTVLGKSEYALPALPISFPPKGEWLLKIVGVEDRFLFGAYRRQMKAIGYLGQLDKLCGVPATTRNWNTIATIIKTLNTSR
jgi:uncharacterized protein (DUF1697 family)